MRDLVIVGLGELGRWLGAGALGTGMRVTPVLRNTPLEPVWASVPVETPIVVAVSEDALDDVLAHVPSARHAELVLLQNELFPSRYAHLDAAPAVLVPWLLKKRGLPQIVIRPTPVFGRHAALIAELCTALHVPCEPLPDADALARALADKYTFILSINALGTLHDLTLGTFLHEHPELTRAVAMEAGRLSARLSGTPIDDARSEACVLEGMGAMAQIGARGRTARARVLRALERAQHLGLPMPKLEEIAQSSEPSS
jgi:hypothetical protein